MKTKLFMIISVVLFFFTCRGPNKPKGIEFAWSPDGNYLAMEQINSRELLLIDLDKHITRIDTLAEAPQWSYDGSYILYYKKNKDEKYTGIFCYSMRSKKTKQLIALNNLSSNVSEWKYFTFWSPLKNELVYISMSSDKNWIMQLVAVESGNSKKLRKSSMEPSYIQWSKDGLSIYYVINESDKNTNNGIWKVSTDGNQQRQMIKVNGITALQRSTDGNYWAYIRHSGDKGEYYQLVLTDQKFQTVQTYYSIAGELIQIDWSPDNKKLICVEKKNDSNHNLWLAGFDTKTLLKVTFDNLENYFGWKDNEHFAYTIQYPDQLVPLSRKDEDNKEISELLSGQLSLNQYFISNSRQRELRGYNIFADTYCPTNNKRAYYSAYRDEMNFLQDDKKYIPVIEFSDTDVHYLVRTPDEETNMTLVYYRAGNYSLAKESIIRYWKKKYGINLIPDFSNFREILNNRTVEKDKPYTEILEDEYPLLLGMILLHRRLNETETAAYLLTQIEGLAQNDSSWNKIEDSFAFMDITTYIKYDAIKEGIRDMDMMMSWRPADSLYCANLCFSQAYLMDSMHDRSGLIQNLQKGIALLPENVDTDELLILGQLADKYQDDKEIVSIILPLGDRLLMRDELDSEVGRLLALMYLTHGDKKKAYLAYQKSVADHFDKYELWQSLLEPEQ